MAKPSLHRFADFVIDVTAFLETTTEQSEVLRAAKGFVARLVAVDDWLPDDYAKPDPLHYRQYLLHCDPNARFSVVSFVWGPGQATPVHDHTVWGVVGVLRGAELSQGFEIGGGLRPRGGVRRLEVGDVETVSPHIGDIHRVANAYNDRPSISIHLYGADIGAVRRSTFDDAGQPKPFVSGYADAPPLDLKPFGIAA